MEQVAQEFERGGISCYIQELIEEAHAALLLFRVCIKLVFYFLFLFAILF